MGFIGLALCFCFAKGPWEKWWVGWRGGWSIRRRDLPKEMEPDQAQEEGDGDAGVGDEKSAGKKVMDETVVEPVRPEIQKSSATVKD